MQTRAKGQKQILILKLGALGDIVMCAPLAAYAKAALPNSFVTWVCGESCAEVLQGNPHIDRIVAVSEARLFRGSIGQKLTELFALYRALANTFDMAVVPYRSPTYSLLVRPLVFGPITHFSRAPSSWKNFVFGPSVNIEPLSIHESLAVLELGKAAFGVLHPLEWDYDFSYLVKQSKSVVGEPETIVIHVGGGANTKTSFDLKKWPHFPKLASALLHHSSCRILLIGGADDEADIQQVVDHCRPFDSDTIRISAMIGGSLTSVFEAIQSAQLFIGPDSGPLHIADALKIPSVGLYGPTSNVSWGLLNKKSIALTNASSCSPCYKDDGIWPSCSFNHICMEGLAVENVVSAAITLLNE